MATDDIPQPDRRFEPYRSASTPRAMHLVNSVVERLEAYEREHRLRRRARKPRDKRVYEETVEAVVCDLAHRFLTDVEGRIAVSLSNQHLGRRSRYRAPALGKALPDILAVMARPELCFLTMRKGTKALIIQSDDGVREVIQKGQVTTLQAGGALRTLIGDHGLGLEDFGRADSEEIIILKAAKTGPKDHGERMEYIDNDQTNRFRSELTDINRWIAVADLDLILFEEEAVIDTHQRRLYRVFNDGCFNRGGRLFGGFWQGLKKDKRRVDLLINGDSIAELDYGQMALRLLYALVGAQAPSGDLYAIPGFEWHREGIKKIINSALFADSPQVRMPQGVRAHIPRNIKYGAVWSAVEDYHCLVKQHFFRGRGMELMYLESEVLIALLLALKEQGIIALPIHDGILVARSDKDTAKRTMELVFKEQTGLDAPVSISIGSSAYR